MKNAFLQSKLDRVLYMYKPDYYNDGTGRVCKLLKSLYGLKQSPLLWYRALDDMLTGANRKKSQVDEALYFKADDDGVACWELVDVDDLLAASSSTAMLKELLEAAFELRKISPVKNYLGLEIVRDRPARKLSPHQQVYFDKLRRRFIDKEQTGRVPKTLQSRERPDSAERQPLRLTNVCTTWPTPVTRLWSSAVDQESLTNYADNYADTDDAGDKQNRTNTGSYVFVFGGAGVSWSSQRIKCATLSSSESKYVAATEAGKGARRLRFLLAVFRLFDAGKPTVLHVDNKSAITLAEGLGLKGNLKHMERRYAWLQHMVKHGKIALQYIPTTEQPLNF
ncbi:unnamed protein product [Closterium sp. NIES-54]